MSQENVEVATRVLEALNRRDVGRNDELFAPDFEWFPAMTGIVEGGSFKGREGIYTSKAEALPAAGLEA